MARFRLFGRSAPAGPQVPPTWYPGVAHSSVSRVGWSPTGAPTSRPGLAAAPRPVPLPRARRGTRPPSEVDPPTDPYGFPPIRTPLGAARDDNAVRGHGTGRAPSAATAQRPGGRNGPGVAQPDPTEAAALAGAFAVDYLSWDEDDRGRRGRVLGDYLLNPVGDPALLGWSGQGRQRGEFALPGLVRSDGEGRVLVDVRVRVTPYRAVGDRRPDPVGTEPDPGVAGVAAVAPAPTGRGWRSLASCWVRLSVPVARQGGRLLVDAGDKAIGLEQPAHPEEAKVAAGDALVDDDPLSAGAP